MAEIHSAEWAEEVEEALFQDLVATHGEVEKTMPRPFGAKDAPMETRLEHFHEAANPVGLSALRKVYGPAVVAREVLELWPKYKERIVGSGEQEIIPPEPSVPEAAPHQFGEGWPFAGDEGDEEAGGLGREEAVVSW
jgi:hypothetical protein